MNWEGEKNIVLPSNTETIEGTQKNSPSFEDKISNQLARFSPEFKNKAIQLITKHHNIIKNEDLFIRKLARSLHNKTEKEAFWVIDKLVKKEIQKAGEQEDIILHEPTISANTESKERNQSTTQETQSTTKETQSTIEIGKKDWIKINNKEREIKTKMAQIETLLANTQDSQQTLDLKLKNHSTEEIINKVQTLPKNTKSKLQENNIKLEDYASFLLSREKIGTDTSSESLAFLESLKNLEQSLWIPEISKGGFYRSFEPQPETFLQNPDLAKYANESQDFSVFDNLEYFPKTMTLEAEMNLIQKFGSDLVSDKNKAFAQYVKENALGLEELFKKDPDLLSEKEKEVIRLFKQNADSFKDEIAGNAKIFMKTGATNAPMAAILKYLDSESLGDQTLSNLLEKPLNSPFAKIHQEGKAQVLHFQGTIDGNPLTFYYNLSNPNASLECDDTLHHDPITKTLSLNKGSGTRTKLNIQMPTSEQLASNLSKSCSPEQFQKIISTSSTPAEYQEQLSQLISSTLKESFSDEKLIKSRLSRHTEKNLTIQTFNSSLIPAEIMQQLTAGKQLNEDLATKNLFRLIDHATENATSSELQAFRSSLNKREQMLQNPEKIKQIHDPVLRSCLEKCVQARENKPDFAAWNEGLLQLFNLFTKQEIWAAETNPDDQNYKLDLDDFSRFVDYLAKPEKQITDDQQLQNFSPAFQEKYENQTNGSLASLEEQIEMSFEFAYA